MKGDIFRIAHLGYYDFTDMVGVLAALEVVLASLDQTPRFGEGVRAAEARYVEMVASVQEPASNRVS
jgi:aspartate aminotransferase-like enzyme